jgi:large subunit ribosomal protein L20
MTRIKRGVRAHRRRKKLLKETKGYIFARKKKFAAAKQAFLKAGKYAYRDRRVRKRVFRRLWITRINNACREYGFSYRELIAKLHASKILLDRKILAELCVNHPRVFAKIVETVKK